MMFDKTKKSVKIRFALLAGSSLYAFLPLLPAVAQTPAVSLSSLPAQNTVAMVRKPEEVQITFPRVIVAEVFTGPIARVVDGETIIVERNGGSGQTHRETIRLFGLMRPASTKAAPSPDGTEPAYHYLNEHLKGKKVRVAGRRRDRDGALEAVVTEVQSTPRRRLLPLRNTDIQPDHPHGVEAASPAPPLPDTSLNLTLLRLGLARCDHAAFSATDTDTAEMAKRYRDAEANAQKDNNGLWASVGSATGSASSAELPNSGKK